MHDYSSIISVFLSVKIYSSIKQKALKQSDANLQKCSLDVYSLKSTCHCCCSKLSSTSYGVSCCLLYEETANSQQICNRASYVKLCDPDLFGRHCGQCLNEMIIVK